MTKTKVTAWEDWSIHVDQVWDKVLFIKWMEWLSPNTLVQMIAWDLIEILWVSLQANSNNSVLYSREWIAVLFEENKDMLPLSILSQEWYLDFPFPKWYWRQDYYTILEDCFTEKFWLMLYGTPTKVLGALREIKWIGSFKANLILNFIERSHTYEFPELEERLSNFSKELFFEELENMRNRSTNAYTRIISSFRKVWLSLENDNLDKIFESILLLSEHEFRILCENIKKERSSSSIMSTKTLDKLVALFIASGHVFPIRTEIDLNEFYWKYFDVSLKDFLEYYERLQSGWLDILSKVSC